MIRDPVQEKIMDLLAHLDDVQKLGGIAVQVDNIGRPLSPPGAGVSSSQPRLPGPGQGHRWSRRRSHRHHETCLLAFPDQAEFVLGFRLGQEIVHLGLGGNGGSGKRLSPVIMTVLIPMFRELLKPLLIHPLGDQENSADQRQRQKDVEGTAAISTQKFPSIEVLRRVKPRIGQ